MSNEFHVVPTDIIEAWAKGEYYVGEIPSISYTRLGTALFLRGWYTYENEPSDPNKLAGVAKIDIKGPFLLTGGIRLIEAGSPTCAFWHTEASHFLDDDDEVIWFHSVLNVDFGDPIAAEIRSKYVTASPSANPSADDRLGMPPDAWNNLLDKLRTDFDADIQRLRERCTSAKIDHGMLRFKTRAGGGHHRCEYYQFYQPNSGGRTLITGASLFKKAAKVTVPP